MAVVAVALGGCGTSEDAQRRAVLDEAVAATVAETLAFNLTIDAPDTALAGFGAAAGPLAELLAGSSAAGVVEDDRIAVGLAVAGLDLVQVRVTGPGEQFVRFDLGALAELATGTDNAIGARLEAALDEAGLDGPAREAVLAAAGGEWVRLATDGDDADDVADAGTSVRSALEQLLLAAEPVGHEGDLGADPFDGQLDVRVDPARAVAVAGAALAGVVPGDLPTPDTAEALDGRLLVADGRIRAFVLELGPLASSLEEPVDDVEDVELVLDLRVLDTGEDLVRAPEVRATVTLRELQRAVDALGNLTAEDAP